VGQAADGRQALQLVSQLKPDIVILDVSMPNMTGTEATKQMLSLDPEVKILAVSAYSDSAIVDGMIQAGAFGYILKDCLFEELAKGVKALQEGKNFFSPKIAENLPAART
jgi:DNA-binding NarL/FixJ family response regulator